MQAAGGDRHRPRRQPPRRGERDPGRARRAGRHDRRSRRRAAARLPRRPAAAARRSGSAATPLELETGRGGVVTSFSSGGPTAFGHRLKPDVGAPGGADPLLDAAESAGGPFAVFDGTSMAAPHVAGAAALLLERHPGWTPRQVKSALVSTAGAGVGRHRPDATRRRCCSRAAASSTSWPPTTRSSSPSPSRSRSATSTSRAAPRPRVAAARSLSTPATAPARGRSRCSRSPQPTGVAIEVPGTVTVAPGGASARAGHRARRR